MRACCGCGTRLGFDSGHLSRLLRQLEGEGLVEVVPDPEDARRRIAHLTAAGKMAWQDLDDRSDVRARQLVDPLTERQRLRLTEALETAERITRAATVDLQIVDPLSNGAQVAVGAYFDELERRFAAGYDPGTDAAAPMDAMAAPHGVFLVASGDGEPVACGGVQRIDDTTGEIKRMWVHPDWRGLGLGGRMLRRLEQETVRLGYERARLETNGTLAEAIEMYAAAGYGSIERYSDSPYARTVVREAVDSCLIVSRGCGRACPSGSPRRPACTSALVFITNGPAQASGSRIGWPPTTITSIASGVAVLPLVRRPWSGSRPRRDRRLTHADRAGSRRRRCPRPDST